MYLKSLEYHGTDNEQDCRHGPEIDRELEVLPEPDMSVDRLSVPVDDIEHRIDFENELIFRRDHIQIPHDRDSPNADLQDDIDDL
jgi:hypothetical protein